MISQREFIESLLDKSKKFKEETFLPDKVELKISELEHFNPIVMIELSKIEEVILRIEHSKNDNVLSQFWR